MRQTGIAKLPLHYGKAPRYLTVRMRRLAKEIATIIVEEYGSNDFLSHLSDPYWFQALGCVLGYDWHSSGVTTVLTGVLKQALVPEEHHIAVCGGKGRVSRQTPNEIVNAGQKFSFSDRSIEELKYASKMSAKVDNTAIQAGYQLYHHAFFVNENRKWTVIQQGMCAADRTARRYHWVSDRIQSFVNEPHNAIVGDARREIALNMTATESEACRKASVDIAREPPKKFMQLYLSAKPQFQKSLDEWFPQATDSRRRAPMTAFLSMPQNINWKTMEAVYEFQPSNYEELLGFKGVGPATVRGLALIADLIYGEKPSWRDPVKYSFAYGGKDGVPFPVDRRAMDESIHILKQAVESAKIGEKDRLRSLQQLRRFIPNKD